MNSANASNHRVQDQADTSAMAAPVDPTAASCGCCRCSTCQCGNCQCCDCENFRCDG